MSELDATLAVEEPKQPVRTKRNSALTKGIANPSRRSARFARILLRRHFRLFQQNRPRADLGCGGVPLAPSFGMALRNADEDDHPVRTVQRTGPLCSINWLPPMSTNISPS